MKKKLFLCFLLILSAVLALAGCQNQCTVTFQTNGGPDVERIVVENGATLQLPDDSVWENYYFYGWYLDESFEVPFATETIITDDVTLYAKWCKVETWQTAEATCTTAGERNGTCAACGQTFSEVIPALGHNFDSEVQGTPATCLEGGTKGYSHCARCNKNLDADGNEVSTDNLAISALGHDYGDGWIYEVAATCTDEGTLGHFHCNRCNGNFNGQSVALQSLTIAATGHSYSTTTPIAAAEATCEAAATVEYFHCDACGKNFDTSKAELADIHTGSALGHNYGTFVPEKPATCTEAGTAGHYTCSRCNVNFNADKQALESLIIGKLGHNYEDWVYEKPATCTEAGIVGHFHCTRCNKNFRGDVAVEIPNVTIDALGHDTNRVPASEATCESAGNVEYYHCNRCNKNLDAQDVEISNVTIAALGHDWGEWTVKIAATVFDKGTEVQTCGRCVTEVTRETDYSVQFARVFITTPSNYPDPITNPNSWASWMWSYHPGDQFLVRYEATDPAKSFDCYAQMKIQGGTSTGYVKKNYSIKLFKDAAQTTKNKVEVVDGWGKENKYCLKANYIDFTSARNLVTADIWNEIVSSRSSSAVVSARENTAKMVHNGAVDGFPVLLYFNGTYYGLYTFNIPKDKWLFGMSKDDNQALIFADGTTRKSSGALWQSTGFKEVIDTTLWNSAEMAGCGWEFEYLLDESAASQAKWVANINQHVQFVLDTYGSVKFKTIEQKRALRDKFRAEAGNYFDIDGCIDYLIFLHCIFGWQDNANKNVLWSTYDGQIWSPNAYDLDTTWGLTWDGTLNLHPDNGNPYVPGKDNKACAQTCGFWLGGGETAPGEDWYHSNMRGNALLDAIMLFYADELEARYTELRADGAPLSYANIANKFTAFISSIPAEVYQREATDFAGRPSNTTDKFGYSNHTDLNQILEFAQYRLSYIDTEYHVKLKDNQNYFGD